MVLYMNNIERSEKFTFCIRFYLVRFQPNFALAQKFVCANSLKFPRGLKFPGSAPETRDARLKFPRASHRDARERDETPRA